MQAGANQQYNDFDVSALINDPFFQDWALDPDEESNRFWLEKMKQYPRKQPIIEEARKLLLSIRFIDHSPDDEQVYRSLSRAMALIDEEPRRGGWVRKMLTWRRVAAFLACALLLGTAFYLYRQNNAELSVSTKYGILKRICLPDSSEIVLNGHSSLRYKKNWAPDANREVWLDGEAFFDVRHQLNQNSATQLSRFIVHTQYLNVEVVGTEFDIRKRRGLTEVVLMRGRIRVYSPDALFNEIQMEPGDMVSFDSADKKIYRSTTIPENYSSWKDKKLVLTNAPLGEIIGYIKDNYGKEIILSDSTLAKRTIGGEVDLSSLQDVLFILSKTLDIDIEEKEDTLLFKSK